MLFKKELAWIDEKKLTIIFLLALSLAVILLPGYGFKGSTFVPLAISVSFCAGFDFLFNFFLKKRITISKDSIIAGLLVGGILTQNLSLHVYAIASLAASASIHFLSFEKKLIFNPANLGIFFVFVFFDAQSSWWIVSPIAASIIFSIFLLFKNDSIEPALSFIFANLVLILFFGSLDKEPFVEILLSSLNGGITLFFAAFIMLDPASSNHSKKQKIFYSVLVAVTIAVCQQYFPFLGIAFALFFWNLASFLANYSLKKSKESQSH